MTVHTKVPTHWHDCCSVARSINRALQGNSLFDWGKSAYRRNSFHTVPKLYTWRHLETCRQESNSVGPQTPDAAGFRHDAAAGENFEDSPVYSSLPSLDHVRAKMATS